MITTRNLLILFTLSCLIASHALAQNDPNTPTPDEVALIGGYLGWGYDAAAGRFADAQALKAPIFTMSKYAVPRLAGDGKGDFLFKRQTFQDDDESSGSTAKEYSQSLAAGISASAEYGMFSGEIKANFSASKEGSSDESFSSLDDVRQVFQAEITDAVVYPDVMEELRTAKADDVIEKYGTHYTAGLRFGGHLILTYSEKATATSVSQGFSTSVKSAYEGIKGGATLDAAQKKSETLKNGRLHLTMYGGKLVGLTGRNFDSQGDGEGQFIPGQFAEWTSSIATKPGLAGFLPNGLVPIYMIPGLSPGRSTELKDAVKRYMDQKANGVLDRSLDVRKSIVHGSSVHLKFLDKNQYVNCIEKSSAYYPIMGNSPQPIHIYRSDNQDGPITHGTVVRLAYVGKDEKGVLRENWGSWRAYCWFYAGNDTTYFWNTPDDQYCKWTVWIQDPDKTTDILDGARKDEIKHDDIIVLQNVGQTNRGYPYLQMDDGNYYLDCLTDMKFWKITLEK